MANNSYQNLMPKETFDQTLENIEALAKVFFAGYRVSKQADVKLQKEILSYIEHIETDILNTMAFAYKAGTFDSFLCKFHGYTTEIKYAVYHVINDPKFKWYIKLFKTEAIQLKFEAVDFALDSLQYRNSQSDTKKREDTAKGGKISTRESKALMQILSNRIEQTGDTNIKSLWDWLERESPILTADGHEIEINSENMTIQEDDRDAIKFSSFRRYVTKAKNKIRSN